jgi:hypothetical protein
MKISIIQFEPNGVPDTDMSIFIPEDGEKFNNLEDEDINQILQSKVEEYDFCEKERGTIARDNFPSLKMENWYFVWIEKISSWIAIYFYTESSPEGFCSPVEVDNTTASGPYDIGIQGCEIIKKYYKSSIPLEDIKKTSPVKLKKQ